MPKLKRYGLDGYTMSWTEKCLDHHTQSIGAKGTNLDRWPITRTFDMGQWWCQYFLKSSLGAWTVG